MSDSQAIDVTRLIDDNPITRFQLWTMFVCGLVAMLDGFDTQVIGFVAPALASVWTIDPATMGLVFAAGLFGLTLGAVTLGPLSDVVGRRGVIIGSTAWFGLFSFLTAYADSVHALAAMRFLTGVGLGGAMPNVIALSAEYAPRRLRTTLVTLMFCGFPLGAVFGGIISAKMIPAFGWPSVFYLGGVIPLALTPLLVFTLPESLVYLSNRAPRERAIDAVMRRLSPALAAAGPLRIFNLEPKLTGAPARHLFARGRVLGTLLLWLMFLSNLLTVFFLMNWLPSIFKNAGAPIEWAIMATVLLNFGGAVGGVLISMAIDRMRTFSIIAFIYLAGAAFVWLIAFRSDVALTATAVAGAGFCLIGAQFGINAMAAAYYPGALRASGVGAALGVGRIGSILGPVLGGAMLGAGWGLGNVFTAVAIPSVVASLCAFYLSAMMRRTDRGAVMASDAASMAAVEQSVV